MQPFTFTYSPGNATRRRLILALVLSFAMFALVQWGVPAQNAHAAGAVAETTVFQQGIVDRTNFYRQQYGCPALVVNSKLNASAQGHSDDMANNDFFSHTGSNGSTPETRLAAAGYKFVSWAESIAAGYSTAESVVDDWFNETPPNDQHRQNILNCKLVEIGVGYTYLADDTGKLNFNYYWVQDFGIPTAATSKCSDKPGAPTPLAPAANGHVEAGKVLLDWTDDACAQTYNVIVKSESKTGTTADRKTGLTVSKYNTKALVKGNYYWRVRACNAAGCKAGVWSMFTLK